MPTIDLGSVVGPQGPQGIQGIQGPQGIQGETGPQGPPGPSTEAAAASAAAAQTSAGAASISAANAANRANDAEAWAVGKINGADVGSSDTRYHNNAKYYAEQAAASATSAASSASDAAAAAESALALLGQVTLSATLPRGRMRGDVDNNGAFTSNDIYETLNIITSIAISGEPGVDDETFAAADMDENGDVDGIDLPSISALESGTASPGSFPEVTGSWTNIQALAEIPLGELMGEAVAWGDSPVTVFMQAPKVGIGPIGSFSATDTLQDLASAIDARVSSYAGLIQYENGAYTLHAPDGEDWDTYYAGTILFSSSGASWVSVDDVVAAANSRIPAYVGGEAQFFVDIPVRDYHVTPDWTATAQGDSWCATHIVGCVCLNGAVRVLVTACPTEEKTVVLTLRTDTPSAIREAQRFAADAEAAKTAIENMTVGATTLAPGSDATVTKSTAGGVTHLQFGIPRGQSGGGGGSTSVAITLSVAGWDTTTLQQTVSVSGVLADETAQLIQPVPASASRADYEAAGVRCVAQAANSLTFTCTQAPATALSVYVVITEVET